MRWCSSARTMRSARLWNMVGFQTKLKHAEQVRLFRTIPGLEKAEFARLGGLHRNTFINSPAAARRDACACARRRTSASPARSPAARAMWNRRRSACSPAASPLRSWRETLSSRPRPTTALGALLGHITGGADAASYQPMNVNFGLFPPLEDRPHEEGRTARSSIPTGPARRWRPGWLLSTRACGRGRGWACHDPTGRVGRPLLHPLPRAEGITSAGARLGSHFALPSASHRPMGRTGWSALRGPGDVQRVAAAALAPPPEARRSVQSHGPRGVGAGVARSWRIRRG